MEREGEKVSSIRVASLSKEEGVSKLTDVGRSNKVSLVSSRLKTVLGHVGVVDGLEVEGSEVGSDGLEDRSSLLGLDLLVGVVLDDETCRRKEWSAS